MYVLRFEQSGVLDWTKRIRISDLINKKFAIIFFSWVFPGVSQSVCNKIFNWGEVHTDNIVHVVQP